MTKETQSFIKKISIILFLFFLQNTSLNAQEVLYYCSRPLPNGTGTWQVYKKNLTTSVTETITYDPLFNYWWVELSPDHSQVFSECIFESCDFSNASLGGTGFREVKFKQCKMLGLNFEHCNNFLLDFQFEGCMLSFSSFFQMKLKRIRFENCNLQEVDFTETDLHEGVSENCDLTKTVFENTLLQKTDFRTAFGFSIDPERNAMSKAKFSQSNVLGLLLKYNIEIE